MISGQGYGAQQNEIKEHGTANITSKIVVQVFLIENKQLIVFFPGKTS